MRKGGSPAKGSAWERAVAKELSLWLTNNERDDIFARNATSGAAFTIASKRGKSTSRMPGDLMAAHPLAFEFLNKISVECKHMASLALENYLFDFSGRSPMTKIVKLAEEQAKSVGLAYMIIAKQNRRDPLILVPWDLGQMLVTSASAVPNYHLIHRNNVLIMSFKDMVTMCDPWHFLNSFTVIKFVARRSKKKKVA